jgi:hypothetical protein
MITQSHSLKRMSRCKMKFKCITQSDPNLYFKGPTGTEYLSKLGETFEVKDKADQEHFSKFPNRFKKIFLLDLDKKTKDNDETILINELLTIGVKKEIASDLADKYSRKKDLVYSLQNGDDLPPEIDKKTSIKIKEWAMAVPKVI